GEMLEQNLRRALSISNGNMAILWQSGVAKALLIMAIMVIVVPTGLTDQATVLAESEGCPRQIVQYGNFVYGFQCHMEFTVEAVEG
ncbi:hypothetical protein ONO12_25665, partial [Salmonella enterica subsp. enterica serovar Montevideo]|nr:hypothetical protein [Salmonella enterica subsp. enterica serovar Montevideo]